MRHALAALAVGAFAALAPLQAHAWWNEAWTTRTRVTLDTSAKGVETREAVNTLAVPVRLHSGNFDFVAAKEDGSDLRVIAGDDKTPLKFTVERYDGLNELALLWVEVPTLAPGSDKNVLHVYAGNAEAPAEPAGAVFASGYAMAVHFGEPEGAAADASGALRSEAPVPREANGLLAGSAKLAGEPVRWAANERLALAAGSALSLSMWIKPDDVAQGTLAQMGPLKLSLAAGKLAVEAGPFKLEGGTLAAAAWSHVSFTIGNGKATLYVNGAQAAQADAALPAISGPLVAGEGYRGLLDELQLAQAVRAPEWIRLSVAAQGADGRLLSSLKEDAGAGEGGGEHGYMGILVKNLTVDAWVVIVILGVMFVIACWVMVTKSMMVGRADRDNRSFLQRFRNASQDMLHLEQAGAHPSSSLYRLYKAGVRELKKRDVGTNNVALSGASLDAVKAAVDADMVRENHHLNAQMVLLTIAISGGPFLGLLGTVVGVMITFAAIAAAGDVNVNAIAPGIAAALLATVAGLAVAIPALFGYNYLAARIKNISADMQIFVDEFVTRVAETYGQR